MALIFLLGRIIFGGFFLENAYNHFKNVNTLSGYAASKHVPYPKLAIEGSGVLLLVGGVSMITGLLPGIGLIAIVLFLLPVSFTMHAYWKESDPAVRGAQRIQFWKNIALVGATLMIMSTVTEVPWPYSL